MRRALTGCRSGLSVAAAVVLLTACGGSDEGTPAASSDTSEPSSSAAESSGNSADSQFCTDADAIQERVGATLDEQSDPAALQQALRQGAAEIRALEPPQEIATDWNALADGVEQIAVSFESIDINDPNALATFEQEVGQLQAQLATASTNVGNYLRDECGLDTGTEDPAVPTS